jgi:hypothetical protein
MIYTADIKLFLTGQFSVCEPMVKININHRTIKTVPVNGSVQLELQIPSQPAGECLFSLVFFNKDYSEFEKYNKDMMINIDKIVLQDYPYDFSKHGIYIPEYPKLWAQQQRDLGNVLPPKICSNYLGWNGEWQLNLEMPVYRWIHKTVNLGWLI